MRGSSDPSTQLQQGPKSASRREPSALRRHHLLALQYFWRGTHVKKFDSSVATKVTSTREKTPHHTYMYLGMPTTIWRKKTSSENLPVCKGQTEHSLILRGRGDLPAQSVDQNKIICL